MAGAGLARLHDVLATRGDRRSRQGGAVPPAVRINGAQGTGTAGTGTDKAGKGADNAGKGTDNADKGTDNAGKGTDNAGTGTRARVLIVLARALNDRGTGTDHIVGVLIIWEGYRVRS